MATQLVLWQLTNLGSWGFGRVAIQRELQELVRALRQVLLSVGFGPGPSHLLADRITQKLHEIVVWIDAVPAEIAGE